MEWMREALERFGQSVKLRRNGEETKTRAFLQPVMERSEQVPQNPTSMGWADRRLWLYLGLEELVPGDWVEWNGGFFRVRSGRPYFIGDALHHWQAYLEAAKEAAEA